MKAEWGHAFPPAIEYEPAKKFPNEKPSQDLFLEVAICGHRNSVKIGEVPVLIP